MPKTTLDLRKKVTLLNDEIEIHKPCTDWMNVAVIATFIIGVCFCIFVASMLMEAMVVIN